MKIINEHGFRCDGRRPHQIRNISVQLGTDAQAEGSAYIMQGNTQVICYVYGPHEPTQRGRMQEDRAFINCKYERFMSNNRSQKKMRRRGKDRKATDIERLVEKAFESAVFTTNFPRTQIDIYCLVIEEDGSTLSACINSASFALCDAGIPMKGVVSSITCGIVDGVVISDVNSREETDMVPRVTLATLSGRDECVLIELQNRVHTDHMPVLLSSAKDTCSSVYECMHVAIRDHLLHTIPIS